MQLRHWDNIFFKIIQISTSPKFLASKNKPVCRFLFKCDKYSRIQEFAHIYSNTACNDIILTNIFQTNQILISPFLLPSKHFHSHTINIGRFQEFAQIRPNLPKVGAIWALASRIQRKAPK